MSFSFNFQARSAASAKAQLAQTQAPAAVKLLVEQAIDAIAWPPPPRKSPVGMADGETGNVRHTITAGMSASGPASPEVFGVSVEVWGHMADRQFSGASYMEKFSVKPLID